MNKDQKERQDENLLLRLRSLRQKLPDQELDAFLISSQANRFYLTGWVGDIESGFVLVTQDKAFIITDSRYTEHVEKETAGFQIIETEEGVGPFIRDLARAEKLGRVGFEAHDLDVFSFRRIKRYAKGVRLVPVRHLVETLRSTKGEEELVAIQKSIAIAEKAFKHILAFIKPGVLEREVAWEMEKYMREKGAEKIAWEPFIVAAGTHSSMAHWGASNSKIKKGDMVQIDYGCNFAGYNCDISRVVFVGKPTREQKKIYNLVLEAQKKGMEMVKEGKNAPTIDKKVKGFLEKHTKYYYRHALGHGVGLQVHELPYVNARRKYKLQVGNVITIEPGIYIPGWGGARIEDMVLVTRSGYKLLTNLPKKIEEVTV